MTPEQAQMTAFVAKIADETNHPELLQVHLDQLEQAIKAEMIYNLWKESQSKKK